MLTVATRQDAVVYIGFGKHIPPKIPAVTVVQRNTAFLGKVQAELDAWFARDVSIFSVPFRLYGTPFQLAVWEAIAAIPYGESRSYGDIARIIGRPGAARAVGGACNRNPVPIIIPCHRVVGSDGSLTGFGGGLDIKSRLLILENSFS